MGASLWTAARMLPTVFVATLPKIVPPLKHNSDSQLIHEWRNDTETVSKRISLVMNGNGNSLDFFLLCLSKPLFFSPHRAHTSTHTRHPFFPPLSHTRAAATPESSLFSLSRPHTLVVHAAHTVCHSVSCCFATYRSLPSRCAHTAPPAGNKPPE